MTGKLFITLSLIGLLFLGTVGPAEATIISFVDNDYAGVDNPNNPSPWSTHGTWQNVGPSFTILGGLGTVSSDSWGGANGTLPLGALVHRNPDGLGVNSSGTLPLQLNQNDRIIITFQAPVAVNGIWVRDLYNGNSSYGPDNNSAAEAARVNFFLNGVWLNPWSEAANDPNSANLLGVAPGVDPRTATSFFNPGGIVVDQIIFRVPMDQTYTAYSEYSVAKLDVSPVPEPATMFLLGSGLIGVGAFVRRKFKK